MARSSTTVTQAEADAYKQFAVDNHLYIEGDDGAANAALIRSFVIERMDSDVTAASLKAAYPRIQSQLKVKSVALRALEAADLNEAEATVFDKWFARQSRLENTIGDDKAME